MGFLFIPIPAALLMAVSSWAALSAPIFPPWLAQAGLAVAVLVIVGGVLSLLPQVMFALFALWLAGASIALMRRQEAE
jgi:F0F1-type ATP synthase assembly protein I